MITTKDSVQVTATFDLGRLPRGTMISGECYRDNGYDTHYREKNSDTTLFSFSSETPENVLKEMKKHPGAQIKITEIVFPASTVPFVLRI